jgi:hypothetical protein
VFSRRGAALYQVDIEPSDRPADAPDVAGRLEQLEDLRRTGRVSDAEYREPRGRILRDL